MQHKDGLSIHGCAPKALAYISDKAGKKSGSNALCTLTVTQGMGFILVADILFGQGPLLQLQSCQACAQQQCMPHGAWPLAALVGDRWMLLWTA